MECRALADGISYGSSRGSFAGETAGFTAGDTALRPVFASRFSSSSGQGNGIDCTQPSSNITVNAELSDVKLRLLTPKFCQPSLLPYSSRFQACSTFAVMAFTTSATK